MPRKIYDIRPPRPASKPVKGTVVIKKGAKRVKRPAPQSHNKQGSRFASLPVFAGILAVLLIVCLYLFFKLPKVEITIWPKVDVLSFEQAITAEKSTDSVDIEKNVIPAKYFEIEKTNAQDFPATGNASNEGKASGTITVYNKYDPPTPFTFKAGTRFMSDSGKVFISPQKVVIPAAKKSGGKITPGTVVITVEAVEGGESYNIAPSNFSVPGLKGTAYYYSINAKSETAMAGGYEGKVKKVTNDDILEAKDVLTEKTNSDALAELRNKIPSDYILLDSAVKSDVLSASTQTKAGAIQDSFNYQATVKASAIAFKKSDLEKFAKDYIISQVPGNRTLLDSSLTVEYSASKVDISGGKANLNISFSSGVYQNVDKSSMALSLLGQNAEQVETTINNSLGEGSGDLEIKFWPFWVKSVPNRQKAVNIELRFQ